MKLYEELAEYTGRDLDLVRVRCEYASYELAYLWHAHQSAPLEFYRQAELYLFDLTQYQERLRAAGWHAWLKRTLQEHKVERLLDYGGGIGESVLTAHDAGVDAILYLDVEHSPMMKYAQWRFHVKRDIHNVHVYNEKFPPAHRCDLIIAMDVLEHVEQPELFIKRFAEQAPLLIANPNEIRFDKWFPQHISKYDLDPFYENVEGNLWRAKR